MVRGLDKFKEGFRGYEDCYVIIGGTACDLALEEAGLMARATKDIDIILVVEALTPEFGQAIWDFVNDGGYKQRERSPDKLEYFRFLRPDDHTFPAQIEFFSRKPDLLALPADAALTPVSFNDGLTSLSAILMDDRFYNFTIRESDEVDGIHRARPTALVPLKARAFLNLKADREKGLPVDARNILKHKLDVFRLALLLTGEKVELPGSVRDTMQAFIHEVKDDLPEKNWFSKQVGALEITPDDVLTQINETYNL